MKKIITLLLIAAMSLSILAGCQAKNENLTPGDSAPQEENVSKSPPLSTVVQAVKDAYAENYLPSMAIEKEQLEDIYSLTMNNIEDYYAEGPMISAHIDTFIAVKAKSGKGSDVEKELQTYLDYVIENSMQYPSNIAKVQSAKVVRHGDYVFYVMLGGFNENQEATEEENIKFAKDQIEIGINAIDNCF